MTDKDEELLADLLLRWEELRELGQETPASELCRDCAYLVEELTRRIHALKVTSWLDKPLGNDSDESNPINSSPTPTRTLIGRYRLDTLIAEGGFAQVWRGYDLELQRVVAVKVPKPSRLQSADAFMAEARRVARLKHPGIVSVFDVGREGDICFIVSEFVEGGSLGDHLVKSPPSQQQAIRWIVEIAEALEYAHLHGVIHRDIKPANILIDHHNRALLADFGIAQSANKVGQQALSLGTLRYMSPEQLEGKAVDPRADIFSLGVVLHETLTGKLPYSSVEPNVLRREIVSGIKNLSSLDMPAELKRICQKALQHDPQLRHLSAAHFAAELRRYLGKPKSSPWLWVVSLFVILTLLTGGLVTVWMNGKPAPNMEPPSKNRDTPAVAIETSVVERLPEESPEKPKVRSSEPTKEQPKQPSQRVTDLIFQGKLHFEKQDYDRATAKFTEALNLDSSNAEAWDKLGACKFNTGDFKGSLSDFTRAIELDPKNAEFCKHRASALLSLQQFEPAIADMEKAISFNPSDLPSYQEAIAIIYSNRAAERANSEQFADALDDINQAIKHFPQGNVFYHQRGSCYFNLKQYEKAAVDFTEAIRREPMKGENYLHRGYCRKALGQDEDAAADFEKAESLGEKK